MNDKLSIRAAAARYRVSPRTLRFYEEEGLLQSNRKEGSRYREYDFGQIKRLEIILLLRKLGFSVREIANLLNGGGSSFHTILRQKLLDGERRVLELRETNRLLRKLLEELSLKPPSDISVPDLLGELIFLSKQTERMFIMTQQELGSHVILIGHGLIPAVFDTGGNLVGKIAHLRAETEASGTSLPIIRVVDESQYEPDAVVIIWNNKEAFRGNIDTDPVRAADILISEIKRLNGK